MRTWNAKPLEVERKWWLIDAKDQTLGRMATTIAEHLRGKNKVQFTPNVDTGDFIIVINADKVRLSGNKINQKMYFTHSRFFGSLKSKTAQKLQESDPERMIQLAVKGMLPENKLSFALMTKLKVYKGSEHPHAAQNPSLLEIPKKKKTKEQTAKKGN